MKLGSTALLTFAVLTVATEAAGSVRDDMGEVVRTPSSTALSTLVVLTVATEAAGSAKEKLVGVVMRPSSAVVFTFVVLFAVAPEAATMKSNQNRTLCCNPMPSVVLVVTCAIFSCKEKTI
jgi:hypothetical protein